MNRVRATVRNGRLVSDEAVDLPEGTELELEVVDDLSDMDPDERAELERALDASADDAAHGRLIDHEEVLRFLDRVRRGDTPMEPPGT
jgi:hypothetical protein